MQQFFSPLDLNAFLPLSTPATFFVGLLDMKQTHTVKASEWRHEYYFLSLTAVALSKLNNCLTMQGY